MFALFVLPSTCTSDATINTDPIQQLINQNKQEPNFTVLLYDKEKTGVFSKAYKHKYRVIKRQKGRVVAKDTEWFPVSAAYYNQHDNNIGMEVAAKDDSARIKQVIGPPGYTNYIGNSNYGYWTKGINDTVVIKEKIAGTTPLTFYDYSTKSTVMAFLDDITKVSSSKSYLESASIDTAYHKGHELNPVLTNWDKMSAGEKKVLASQYYWKFYPHQAYISTLLQLPTGKIKLEEHQQARQRYRRGYSYYGIWIMGGHRRYGTYSRHTQSYSSGRRFGRGGGGFGK